MTFSDLVDIFLDLIDYGVYFIFALTLLYFIWGIVKAWVIGGGDEKSLEDGKKIALAGIIGLVVMSGIWGILQLLRSGIFGI